MPAAKASDPRPKKCWLLTLHPPVSACRMVTCVTPCQCLTLLSDPIKKSRKMPMPAAKASDPRPKKCWLLTLHPPVNACRMVTCLTPCQCLTLLMCWLLTLHPPASACRMVTCVNPCQCLTLLSDPMKKSRKMLAARGQSQRSKTQKMLAPNASSPCQRLSNGYLCQPLPVPNAAF